VVIGFGKIVSETDAHILIEPGVKYFVRIEAVAGGANQPGVTWPDLENAADPTVVAQESADAGGHIRRRGEPPGCFKLAEDYPVQPGLLLGFDSIEFDLRRVLWVGARHNSYLTNINHICPLDAFRPWLSYGNPYRLSLRNVAGFGTGFFHSRFSCFHWR
jgi:hypothetical protein